MLNFLRMKKWARGNLGKQSGKCEMRYFVSVSAVASVAAEHNRSCVVRPGYEQESGRRSEAEMMSKSARDMLYRAAARACLSSAHPLIAGGFFYSAAAAAFCFPDCCFCSQHPGQLSWPHPEIVPLWQLRFLLSLLVYAFPIFSTQKTLKTRNVLKRASPRH